MPFCQRITKFDNLFDMYVAYVCARIYSVYETQASFVVCACGQRGVVPEEGTAFHFIYLKCQSLNQFVCLHVCLDQRLRRACHYLKVRN